MRTAPDKICKATSNADFGRRVGLHYTMASRLRNGKRMPSSQTLAAIRDAFELSDHETAEMMNAVQEGVAAFGRWLDANLFEESSSVMH